MNSSFGRNLIVSTAAHCLIILILIFGVGFIPEQKPVEKIQVFDLVSEMEALPLPNPSNAPSSPLEPPAIPDLPPEPQPPSPPAYTEPIVPPESTPPPAEPMEPMIPDKLKPPVVKPKEPPKKIPPKTAVKPPPIKKDVAKPTIKPSNTEPKIKISTTPVKRPVLMAQNSKPTAAPTQSTGSAFNQNDFKIKLLGKLPPSDFVTVKGGNGSGQTTEFSSYFSKIIETMYHAWQSPFGMTSGTRTLVAIRIEKNGNISKVSLATSSGNKEMDDSALSAANSVQKLPPLPDGLGGSFVEININFKVQK